MAKRVYGRLDPAGRGRAATGLELIVAVSMLSTVVVTTACLVLFLLQRSSVSETPSNTLTFSYAPAGMSVPLVLDLHGAGGDPLGHWVWSGMRDCALQRGWHVAYPAGVGNTWNAGPGMYAPASGSDVMPATDHVGNLSSLANRMRTSLNASRVFVTGISNGCAMALRLGLEAYAGTIDAVACNGHKMHPSIRTREPPEPRPLLLITGSHDPWFADPDAVHNTLHEWMINNNCTGTLNSNSTFGNVTVSDAGSCRAAVRHVLFHGAGHIVPLHRAAEMQCEFLERYV